MCRLCHINGIKQCTSRVVISLILSQWGKGSVNTVTVDKVCIHLRRWWLGAQAPLLLKWLFYELLQCSLKKYKLLLLSVWVFSKSTRLDWLLTFTLRFSWIAKSFDLLEDSCILLKGSEVHLCFGQDPMNCGFLKLCVILCAPATFCQNYVLQNHITFLFLYHQLST